MGTWSDQVNVLLRHCADTFGEHSPATFTAEGGSPAPFQVPVVFYNAGEELDMGGDVDVRDRRPVAHVFLADLVAGGLARDPVRGDRLTIGGTVYRPEDIDHDSLGRMVALHLLEVPT